MTDLDRRLWRSVIVSDVPADRRPLSPVVVLFLGFVLGFGTAALVGFVTN